MYSSPAGGAYHRWAEETKTRNVSIKKEPPMSRSVTSFAIQLTASVAIAGLIGAALFTFADFATRGVVV